MGEHHFDFRFYISSRLSKREGGPTKASEKAGREFEFLWRGQVIVRFMLP
jgi:hypothetical protein